MKVTVVVTFQFTDSSGQVDEGSSVYQRSIEMPAPPTGVAGFTLVVEHSSVHVEPDKVHWNEPHSAYVVTGTATVTSHYRKLLSDDDRWLAL